MKQKIIGILLTPIAFLLCILLIISTLVGSITVILSGGQEEEANKSQSIVYENCPLSPEVEALRNQITEELKKYSKEEYVDLVLAVIQQESGGQGEDIFQCSESLGKSPNSIDRKTSIQHGVKVLCGYLNHEKVKVSSPDDLDHIRIALQAYNYGGGYINYINDASRFGRDTTRADIENLGKWTQKNALAYQKQKSAEANHGYPVARTGSAAQILGPYTYGDAYYNSHVLRYYPPAGGDVNLGFNVKAGDAAKVDYKDKTTFMWGSDSVPTSSDAMQKYLTTISVPIYNEKGKKTTMNITVHKKLAAEFKAIFEDMAKIKFRIKASETYTYVWKNIIGTSTVSQHSYGAAIDINASDNPCFYNTNVDVSNGYGAYQPGKNQFSVTKKVIKIWKEHGFYWGGDWRGKKDTMHFSYTEKP